MSEQVRRKLKAAMQENARLQAENEKYRRCFQGERDWVLMEPGEHARIEAQVERLTKAGDLICRMAGNNEVINRHWKAAKKGVQS